MTNSNHVTDIVSTEERLREILGFPGEGAVAKELRSLDRHARYFIERSPFALLSSASRDGRCDVSPKGDVAGFVKVLDDRTLLIPDRPGNRRGDTFSNLLENPHLGIIFLVPDVEETLRVNGRAVLSTDGDLLSMGEVNGKLPKLAIVVETEEVYFHCAKAFKRSGLWKPDTWLGRGELPTLGQIMVDQIRFEREISGESLNNEIEEAYVTNLY
ncbi:MAG: pyridoxamine 5'-phosphate oxidase family protein [Thermomicrobiales bacterium]